MAIFNLSAADIIKAVVACAAADVDAVAAFRLVNVFAGVIPPLVNAAAATAATAAAASSALSLVERLLLNKPSICSSS